ncbi:major facilitator superfamily transporter [Xylogone sp. PMI_703]|nr:major facilitator superfamily transporter [Xylogone sp. PMI_703]
MAERVTQEDEHGSSEEAHSSAPTENTPLLSQNHENRYQPRDDIPDDETIDDTEYQDEIEPNEFDLMLSKSTSYTGGLGIEAESQETAMLRGPRTYTSHHGVLHRSSQATLRRKSNASSLRSREAIIAETYEDDENKSPFLQGVSVGRFWLIFGCILICYCVACFDGTIMVSSHPVITSYFHSSNSASWLSTAFLLTSTSFQPLCGRLSDTLGRKPPYIITIAIFLGATIWCALAQSMTSFILARAVCGLGAGGMMALGSIITSDLVPIEIRGAYQSYLNLIYGVGSTLGAATGGAIADHLGWRWEFGVQVPAIALCLLIAIVCVPNDLGLVNGAKRKTLWQAMSTFDFGGSFLLTTSLTFLILGFNLGGNVFEWSHPFVIASLAIFAVGFPIFLWVETRVLLPIMPLRIILSNPRAGLIIANSLGAIVANAITFNVPLYFQAVLLESATSSGLKLIVPALASSLVGTATGFIITYTRNMKMPLLWGVITMVIGTISLCFMQRGLPDWAYYLFLVASSVGQGFMFPATFMAILAVSDQAEQAVVTSTLILWRSLGMVMGVSASSLVVQNALRIYLNQYITGPDKSKIIEAVRSSVQAIAKLEPIYREQAIESYVGALKANFIMAAIFATIALMLTIPLKLPLLGKRT